MLRVAALTGSGNPHEAHAARARATIFFKDTLRIPFLRLEILSYIFIYCTYGLHESNFPKNSLFSRSKKPNKQKFHKYFKNDFKKFHTIYEGSKRFDLNFGEMTIQPFKIVWEKLA